MTSTLRLPEELTIYTACDLRRQWLAWLDEEAVVDSTRGVGGAAVAQVDAAGLQLLLSLVNAARRRDQTIEVRAASDALRDACAALGLTGLLAPAAQGATP